AALRGDAERAPPDAVRRRPPAGRALYRRSRGSLPRLLEAPGDGRDGAAPRRAGRGGGPAGAYRCDVPRRQDQRRRAPTGPPRGTADAPWPVDRKRLAISRPL